MFYQLNLKEYFNSTGITTLDEASKGSLDIFANLSFPKEYFQENMYFNNIPFKIELDSILDNISIDDELKVSFERNNFTDVYILGACNNGNFSNNIHFYSEENLIFSKKIHITDLMEEIPYKRNEKFVTSDYVYTPNGKLDTTISLWVERIQFSKEFLLDSLTLEENPFIHIFAITLGGEG
ncbi:hypothetical protein BN2127_JRS3_01775 [Bacillus safensis]|uniref:hypothetical protein n=1 Tax=Bacillus safensis TaxID=561879 RepID=UPI0006A8F8C6|nr:hypothetical protein [Bacillus safensis]CUB19111.1 hypothetical protein BN2127_JRS3_01775 [Bacillus safensis]